MEFISLDSDIDIEAALYPFDGTMPKWDSAVSDIDIATFGLKTDTHGNAKR